MSSKTPDERVPPPPLPPPPKWLRDNTHNLNKNVAKKKNEFIFQSRILPVSNEGGGLDLGKI